MQVTKPDVPPVIKTSNPIEWNWATERPPAEAIILTQRF